jgi:hypothetical protein
MPVVVFTYSIQIPPIDYVLLLSLYRYTGILVTLLLNFLCSKTNHPAWLKIYIVFANALTAVQTVVHIIQAFEGIDAVPPQTEVSFLDPSLISFLDSKSGES